MASVFQFFLPFICFYFITFSRAQEPFLPNSIVLPVSKDLSSLQYVTHIYLDSSAAPLLSTVKLVIDLEAPFSWFDCGSASASHNSIQCFSLQCSMAKFSSCNVVPTGSTNKMCTLQLENPITKNAAIGDLREETIAVEASDGLKTGSLASFPEFLFSRAPTSLLKGLSGGAKGMLGLGNTRIALASQVSSTFGFSRKFSLCLSSTNGVIISGGSPKLEISRSLLYTPLEFEFHQGYYIKLKSIRINGKKLSINSSLLSKNHDGVGGTKISTTAPYTTLESTIYGTFIEAYNKAANAMNMIRASSVPPFEICFSSKGVETKRVGPNVPVIDFVLQSEMVKWRIHGWNSMVHVSDEILCLGFLNGGSSSKASVVIGGHQLEEKYLEFNLENSMLGFSSSSFRGQRSCSGIRSNSVSSVAE